MIKLIFFIFISLINLNVHAALDVKDLIRRTEQQSMGETFHGRLRLRVERGERTRELEILTWAEGKDKSLVKVLAPPKDRGTGNLRLEFNLWQYLPKIERVIKVPAGLMFQSWMGSDFTNDDLVKASRYSRDYDCIYETTEMIEQVSVEKLICNPKPNAPVVWGKLFLWIEPKKAVLIQQNFFTEKGELVKQLKGSDIKLFGGHTIATKLVMKTIKKNTVTTLEYLEGQFDLKIDKSKFTQLYLQKSVHQ